MLCVLQLLSLYSPVLKERFLKAEKGVVDEELPIVKIEGESIADIRTLLDLLYPDTDKLIDGMSKQLTSLLEMIDIK